MAAKKNQIPDAGRIVRYVDDGGLVWPAIIVRVKVGFLKVGDDPDRISLVYFSDTKGALSEISVGFDADEKLPRTWHWPEF